MTRRALSWLLGLVVLGCGAPPRPAAERSQITAGPRRFVVHSLWLAGPDAGHRAELDRFLQCLLAGSTFVDFWAGRVALDQGGSWVVPAPSEPIGGGEAAAAWLAPALDAAGVPTSPPGVTPIYLVYGEVRRFESAACGRCDAIEVAGRPAGLALVRTSPACWPGQGLVRGLTQYTQHELSCALELLQGQDHCAADGQCLGDARCPDPCDTFTGLYCPGAPERSYTGCDATPVRGWVVQKLSHKGEGRAACPFCAPCDFTVRPRAPAGPPW